MTTPGLGRPILKGAVNFPVCLAPMVGLSHLPFRRLLRSYLPHGARVLWPTEMLSTRRLPHEKLGRTPETLFDDDLLVPQILGNEERFINPSVKKLEAAGAGGIDINMGCPVRQALRHNYGVALMGDPQYAAQVVEMTVRSTGLPVSVKLRAGFQSNSDFLKDFVLGLERAGASHMVLHPRTAEQRRRGRADWGQIRRVRETVKIPVIGNGDVQCASDAERMFLETGADGVMVGRALVARPWMLWQLGEKWGWPPPEGREGRAPSGPDEEAREMGLALFRLLDELQKCFSWDMALKKFRFFVRTGSPWLNFGHELHSITTRHNEISPLIDALRMFFQNGDLRMSERTQLSV